MMHFVGFILIILNAPLQIWFLHKANKRTRQAVDHKYRLARVAVKTPFGDDLPEGSDDYRAGWQACRDAIVQAQIAESRAQLAEL